jgi:hypothetical protein
VLAGVLDLSAAQPVSSNTSIVDKIKTVINFFDMLRTPLLVYGVILKNLKSSKVQEYINLMREGHTILNKARQVFYPAFHSFFRKFQNP